MVAAVENNATAQKTLLANRGCFPDLNERVVFSDIVELDAHERSSRAVGRALVPVEHLEVRVWTLALSSFSFRSERKISGRWANVGPCFARVLR